MSNTCPTTPFEKKTNPFSTKVSPYSKASSKYSSQQSPYASVLDGYDEKHFCPALLQENGYYILLEDGGLILL